MPVKDHHQPIQSPFAATASGDYCFTKGGQPIYRCRATGCYFFARSSNVGHDYQTYYPYLASFDADRARWEVDIRRSGFKRSLGVIRKHASGVRLLDVGAGPGYYLQISAESGFLAAGIELSHDAREFGVTHYGVNYVNPSDVKPASVDIILLRHVLEHIDYPIPFVQYLSSLLSPSGIVFVQVPIFRSPTQRLKSRLATGSVSCNLYGDEHISGFEANSLVKFLGLMGLYPVKVWSSGLYSYDYDPIFSRLFLDRSDYLGLAKKLLIGAIEQPFTLFGQGHWICGIFCLSPHKP